MVKAKEQQLAREDAELRKAWQREEDRQQWLDELSTERLVELLLPVLQHHWLTESPMRVDDEYDVLPQEVAARLAIRGFKGAEDPVLLKKEGLLHSLEKIRSRHFAKRSLGKWGGLVQLAEEPTLQKYLTLGLIAVRAYPLNLSPEDVERVKGLRKMVKDSLDSDSPSVLGSASRTLPRGRWCWRRCAPLAWCPDLCTRCLRRRQDRFQLRTASW